MSVNSINPNISTKFETSVNDVIDYEKETVNLPFGTRLKPVRTASVNSHSQTLLNPESVHQLLLKQWLRPSLVDPSVVQPARFNTALSMALEKMSLHKDSKKRTLRDARKIMVQLKEHRYVVSEQMTKLMGA